MWKRIKRSQSFHDEAGSVLLIIAAAMVVMLAVSALAIDVANLYLARNQAQRAADSAALGGAYAFLQSGCLTGGCTSGGPQETLGRQYAESSGDQNYIAGQLASIQDGDISFSYPNPQEPQITVDVGRTVPTFFAKIFGVQTANVSVTATAEAYSPGGAGPGGSGIGATCIKPFLVPDCDPNHETSPDNPNCSGQGYFFDPSTGDVLNPQLYTQGGIKGMPWQLHTKSGPSQWYLVGFGDAPPSSGSALRNHIIECTPGYFSCNTTLVTANGNNVGPIDQGVDGLINALGDGMNQGQDTIDTSQLMNGVFPVTGGSNNPNPLLPGATILDYTGSSSVVTVPVYSGVPLTPGGSTVGIDGYLQVFIQDANHQGTDDIVDMIILNAFPCGGASGGGGGAAGGGSGGAAGSPVPIRLIRTD
ncbi:MAG TPA: pilus assembly protein TadG-related protein [Terriglobia bacterium]|nr:pilus assembly protein TadG-related protein [Terriglobia bacterium]